MIIRVATPKDAKECVKLVELDKESYWETTDFEISTKDKDVVFLVAEEDSRIVGYALGFTVPTKRTEALVHETRVDKKERGKGIGTKLVNALCEEFFKRGVRKILAEIEPQLMKFYADSCKFKKATNWIEVVRSNSD